MVEFSRVRDCCPSVVRAAFTNTAIAIVKKHIKVTYIKGTSISLFLGVSLHWFRRLWERGKEDTLWWRLIALENGTLQCSDWRMAMPWIFVSGKDSFSAKTSYAMMRVYNNKTSPLGEGHVQKVKWKECCQTAHHKLCGRLSLVVDLVWWYFFMTCVPTRKQ